MPKRRFSTFRPNNKRRRVATRRPFRMAVTRFRRRRRQNIPRYITPDRKLIKLRYSYTTDINPASGATGWESVACNDLTVPSSGTGAHQPLGFDQIMQLYERYCVVGSKINVAFMEQSTPLQNQGTIVGIALRNSTTQESVQDNTASQPNEGLLERNRTVWKYMTNNQAGGTIKQVTSKFGAKKFFQLSSVNDNAGNNRDEGTLWGTASSSPTTKAYYNVFGAPIQDDEDVHFSVRITVEYLALFSGRKLLGQS